MTNNYSTCQCYQVRLLILKKRFLYQVFNNSGIVVPFNEKILYQLVKLIQNDESCCFQYIEVVFVDDSEILRLNQQYLGHNYITDILTFPYDENSNRIFEGTLFCCATRIREQALTFKTDYRTETYRVVTHGLLHLAGYDDATEKERQQMRNKESYYILQLYEVLNAK